MSGERGWLSSEDYNLTDAQLLMLIATKDDTGFELSGKHFVTARALARKGLGSIDEGGPLPPLFWPNAEGLCVANEFNDGFACQLCGAHAFWSGHQ